MGENEEKIGITGDTHGSKQAIRQVLHAVPPVEYWFHTGDYSQDGRFLVAETKLPLLAVCGNTDPGEGKANVDEFITLDIVICMGIRYPNWPGGHVSWKLILWFSDIHTYLW